MKKKRFNWNLLLRLINKYRDDAERCMDAGAYFAGLVSVRAALETMLYARFLLELFDKITDDTIEVPGDVSLYELIQEAYKQELLNKTGFHAAERIRKWGNKIHCSQVANDTRLPGIGKRNLQARLDDLEVVSEQLLSTL